MKAVIQRVSEASVRVGEKTIAAIDKGLLVLVGIGRGDTEKDAESLAKKISDLRMFEDKKGHIHHSVKDVGGEIIVVSQFTLYGDCRKGRRPSFTGAESPERAKNLYRFFVQALASTGVPIQEGVFQEMMEVVLVNDGPFTLLVESPPL
jgi:D-tyrosyl-tRNA(Tyr) deacylase